MKRPALGAAMGLIGLLGGCSRPGGETQQINASLLKLLTSQNQAICVDEGTHGEPLVAFRTMLTAPDPARRPLVWRTPAPLESGRRLTGHELIDIEFHDEQTTLPERNGAGAVLPTTVQVQLNALAREGSFMSTPEGVTVGNTADAPLAKVRWWIRNRFDGDCGPPYTISKPVLLHGVAFVTVTAGHRGSTYAFQKLSGTWKPVAKWASWLY